MIINNQSASSIIKYITCVAIGFLLATLVMNFNSVRRVEDTNVHTKQTTPPKTISSETSVTVVPKDSTGSDADLVVKNVYVAEINGERVEAPMSPKGNTDDKAVIVNNVVDITPLVKQMTPKWEAGVGVEYDSNNKVLPCMSLQRNYKHNRAVEMIVTIDKDCKNIERGMLLHKWMF